MYGEDRDPCEIEVLGPKIGTDKYLYRCITDKKS